MVRTCSLPLHPRLTAESLQQEPEKDDLRPGLLKFHTCGYQVDVPLDAAMRNRAMHSFKSREVEENLEIVMLFDCWIHKQLWGAVLPGNLFNQV